jgi:hypothetical protein
MNFLVFCGSRFAGWVFCKVLPRVGITEEQLPAVGDLNNTPFVSRVNTDRVLRVHMVGKEAGEIIQGMAIAVNMGATKKHFDATIGIHPSTAEEFVTLR